MCDCIERIEKMLNEKMIEQHPGTLITEEVELQSKALMLLPTGLPSQYQMYSSATGRFVQGKGKRKFDVNMYYTYCPFCGEKY